MMKKIAVTRTRSGVRRFVAGLLCLTMLCGLVPAMTLGAKAAGWAQPYMDQLTEWGVLRGEEAEKDPNEPISRAEFVTLLNRTFGYKLTGEKGYLPFTDVSSNAWYYDDIKAAYDIGYFTGVPGSLALPNDNLTRAQAVVAIGRNLMLEEETGEVHEFSDGRSLLPWARGMVKAAYKAEIISGSPSGAFNPNEYITRGEMACLLTKAVGTLVQEPRENELGNVYGNVTINSSGVTLKNTTVAGNLYLTGGISLGEVTLDNVRVLGRIVVSGAGEAHEGDTSVTMRNVVADEMVVDSVEDQFVTIQVQGNSNIGVTRVRTPAYLQDMTGENYGMKQIDLEAEESTTLQLVGNIKKVVNLTPYSQITVAQGTVDNLTVDEEAVDSRLDILNGGRVKQLSLDVGTTVAGRGDIDHVDVAASGVTVAQLPNTITVRPGLESNIAGEVMDTVAADESSQDPRLLPGYPNPTNVAPTTADLVFSTNKRGTIYWVLTNLADASVSASEVINPPKTDRILASGSIPATASNTEYKATVSRLVSDGSYYVTAILVDSRGQRSPVKVAAFTTPDNTVPAFASGYPKVTLTTKDSIQVGVMPNKSCQLYYAIMNKGATAPTVQQFRAGAISGDLGHGVRDVTKNSIDVFTVNTRSLLELNDYVVYLCLVDADGGKASKVVTLNTKTADGTPPVFLSDMTQNKTQATSVGLTATIDEKGTIYWVAVEAGTGYPAPLPGTSVRPALSSEAAKSQVINGMNGLKSGKVSATANKPVSITISGLTAQKAYDVYYLAVDAATPNANMSESVKKITVRTEDTTGPTVVQGFDGDLSDGKPMPGANIQLVFNESIQAELTDEELNSGSVPTAVFLTAYTNMTAARAAAKNDPSSAALKKTMEDEEKRFADLLKNHLTLMYINEEGDEARVLERSAATEAEKDSKDSTKNKYDWKELAQWVDYRKVTVKQDENGLTVTFPNGVDSAVRMASNVTYFFRAVGITDTQGNRMGKTGSATVSATYDYKVKNSMLPQFTTATAKVVVRGPKQGGLPLSAEPTIYRGVTATPQTAPIVDMFFRLRSDSADAVSNNTFYDVIFWSAARVNFDLYARVVKKNDLGNDVPITTTALKTDTAASLLKAAVNKTPATSAAPDAGNSWIYLGECAIKERNGACSLNNLVQGRETFCKLNELSDDYIYEFAIQVTKIVDNDVRKTWGDEVVLKIDVVSGDARTLNTLLGAIATNWDRGGFDVIGDPPKCEVNRQFINEQVPTFANNRPQFIMDTNDPSTVQMSLQLTNPGGTVYYALEKLNKNAGGYTASQLPLAVTVTKGTGEDATEKELSVLTEGVYPHNASGAPDYTKEPKPDFVDDATKYQVEEALYVAPENGIGGYKLGGGVADWDPEQTTNTYQLGGLSWDQVREADTQLTPANTNANIDILVPKPDGVKVGSAYPTTEPLTGLEPGTTYFVYLAVKGNSDAQSPVYVFQFTTPPAKKPTLTLGYLRTGTGTHATDEVVSVKPETAADVSYIVINTTLSKPTELFGVFNPTGTGWDTAAQTRYATDLAKGSDGNSNNFSILDALMNTITTNGPSIFDEYATAQMKKDLQEFIAGTATTKYGNELVKDKSGTPMAFTADKNNKIAAKYAYISHGVLENLTTSCFFLAVAVESTDNKPENEKLTAFRGIGGISKPDTSVPDISSVSVIQLDETTPEGTAEANKEYTGRITIVFTGPVAYNEIGGSQYLLYGSEPAAANKPSDPYKVIGSIIDKQMGTGATVEVTQTGRITNQITLKFTKIKRGDAVMLFENGYVGNTSGRAIQSGLYIEFSNSEYLNPDAQMKIATPRFTIRWAGSDWVKGKGFDWRAFTVGDGEITNSQTLPKP